MQRAILQKRFSEVRSQLIRGLDTSLRRELHDLKAFRTLAQEEWNSPNLSYWPELHVSNRHPYAARIGSHRIALAGEDILLPVFVELLASRNLLIVSGTEPPRGSDAILSSLICRHLVMLPPGKLLLRFADLSKFGASLSHYIQSLPAAITSGQIAYDQTSLDSLFAFLQERIAEVHRTVISPLIPSVAQYEATQPNGFQQPYYLVVLDNFPAGMDERRLETLRKIMENGPKAGVTIVVRAEGQNNLPAWISKPTPPHLVIVQQGQYDWALSDSTAVIEKLKIDTLPNSGYELAILQRVTQEYERRHAAPEVRSTRSLESWWNGNCSEVISVEIGHKTTGGSVFLTLNEQALVGGIVLGSPGSGKSNFLHVIISELVTNYPPNALNIYAIDLKGVEFNVYAGACNPHFKLIASNMSAEIGLEALREIERLMKARQAQFSAKTVSRLSQYVQKTSSVLPRLVLIIDEFHRLFETSHTAAQEAEKILTNLLKQGRSFGIHLLLATQSLLAGKVNAQQIKSLVSVRVALRANDLREHRELFGSSFDTPPELGTPGYALIMDTMVGNEDGTVFRCPLMSDEARQSFLTTYRAVSAERGYATSTALLLDGVAKADIRMNEALGALAEGSTRSHESDGDCVVWIGDAFSMTKRAELVFRSQARSNLLLVMQDRFSNECESLCCAMLLAIVGGSTPGSKCYVSIPSAASADDLRQLRTLSQALPSSIELVDEAQTPALVDRLLALLTNRRGGSGEKEAHFWFVPQLHRCNDLRVAMKADSPSKKNTNVEQLLQDGARVGIHVIVWSDSTNLIDYQWRSHFNFRVSSRVEKDDSKVLFDMSDAAAQLPDDLGFFWDAQSGSEPTIFRPYTDIPGEWRSAWLKRYKETSVGAS